MVTDETFFAWLDGELDPQKAERIAAEVAADDKLAERAKQHRAMQSRLKGPFDRLLDAEVPDPLLAVVHKPEPEIIDFAAAQRSRDARRWTPLPQWAAVAATLAVGIFVGTMVSQRSNAPVEVQGGRVYAAAALNHALDAQLASAPSGDIRIGLTFRDQGGAICRSFTQTAASGLACRDNGRWQVRGLFAAPEGQSSDYRMAAGMDPNLAALVDSTMAGEPLDAKLEKAARERGWR
ncbi:MAG TPA: anti-sigma factor [Sphingomicrobium sp.]|nr:anti-sigma factor [Sphingomicrobium sp.]